MVREWYILKALKCADRDHDPSGIDSTQPGGLAITCRACPHPGKNLAEGWQDAPSKLA